MKYLLSLLVAIALFPSLHAQSCYTQDTNKIFRQHTRYPSGIAISGRDKLVVTACRADTFGRIAPVKIWNKRSEFMEGYGANDSLMAVGAQCAAFDTAGNLYVVQTQRSDSNILIYDDTLGVIGVIDNSVGAASWCRPRGIAFDAAQNLYVVSDDSVGPGPLFTPVPHTGKLIKIAHPLYIPTKTVLLTGLNGPKGITIAGNSLYLTEVGNSELSRYDLTTMNKVDSVALHEGMDIATADCKLFATEQHTNSVAIFNAANLGDTTVRSNIQRPRSLDGKMGVTLDIARDLFFDVNDSNEVIFFRGIVPPPTYTGADLRFCISSTTARLRNDTSGTWVSGDTTILRVDNSGAVTGYRAGGTSVYHIHGITDTFYVIVDVWDTAGLGQTYAKKYATDLYDTAHTCLWYTRQMYNTGSYTMWSSSDMSKAYINWQDGNVWPQDTGKVYILCSKGNSCGVATDSFLLTIDPDPRVDTIAGPAGVCYGTTARYTNATPNGRWFCTDTAIATIDAAGNVHGIGVGTATISYKTGNICDSIVAIKTISILHDARITAVSGPATVCLHSIPVFSNDSTGGYWVSSNPSVMEVASSSTTTADGTPHAEGFTVISYVKSNECGYDSMIMYVNVLDTARAYITGPDSACMGNTDTMHMLYSGGTWSTSNSAIASVNNSGVVFGVAAGTAYLTYTITTVCNTDSRVHSITIMPIAPATVNIVATPSDSVRYSGEPVYFYATPADSATTTGYQWYVNGSPVAGATARWFTTAVTRNDTVWCATTTNAPCASPGTSNTVIIFADYLGVATVANTTQEIALYPNPNNGQFIISGTNLPNQTMTVEIRDVKGVLVASNFATVHNGLLHTPITIGAATPAGNYWVRIISKSMVRNISFTVSK